MGFSSFYQAIPEESDLNRLLRDDRAVDLLLASLWSYGGRPLDLREMGREELEELVEDWVEALRFEDRAHVDRTLARLDEAIHQTCSAHPGLMDRTAFVEKVHDDIENCLSERLQRNGQANPRELIQKLLFGESPINPQAGFPHDGLYLINASTVEMGALILSEIDYESLDLNQARWNDFREDFQGWKELYVEAAGHGEAILVHGQ